MHPYAAVDTEKTTTVEAFRNGLPGKGSENISFTEVGAYYCKKGESVSGSENASREAYQAKHAAYLVNTLIPHTTNLEHVFYYESAFEGTKRIDCSNVEDTELYAPPSEGQANQPRSAASIMWGPEGKPSASTGAASGIAPLQATLNGIVNPQGMLAPSSESTRRASCDRPRPRGCTSALSPAPSTVASAAYGIWLCRSLRACQAGCIAEYIRI